MEIWKTVNNYPEYEASNMGNVRNKKTKKILIGGIKRGYRQVILVKDKKNNYKSVHRIIAMTFIPNPNNLPQVNHKDGNKLNNSVDNLEWVTQSDNMIHAYKLGLQKPLYAKDNPRAKKVRQYSLNNVFIKEYNGIKEASRFNNLNPRDITKCCQKKRKQVGGFIWTYSTN